MGSATTRDDEIRPELVERRTIEAVPVSERHGRTRDLFNIWFAANVTPLTFVTGALAAQVFGLSLWWSVVAILVGNLGAGMLMALHSAQGPRLGVPQMIQSRGQFGNRGSLLVVVLVLVMYEGFFASNLVVGGDALNDVFPAVNANVFIVLCALISLLVSVAGYRIIHRVGRYGTWLCGVAYMVTAVWVFAVHGFSEHALSVGGVSFSGFMSMVAIGALWQIAYAPYVSDYSRYMPADRASRRSTLWATYWGCCLGTVIPMILGAAIAVEVSGDTLAGLKTIMGAVAGGLMLFIYGLVVMHLNSMNLYGATLTLTTAGQSVRHTWFPRTWARIGLAIALVALSVILALAFQSSFLTDYTNFISLLEYVLIPWTAINLADFYLVRHGNYDVASFFRPDGGVYGQYQWKALIVYVIGICVEIPFMSTTLYTGPVAHAIGADITWLVGLAITTPLYLLTCRIVARRGDGPALRENIPVAAEAE